MIVGIGIDRIEIRRIEQTLARFGTRFTMRLFTERERALCDGRRLRAASYAKRFAAKEAAAKALGTGMRQGVAWRDLEVVSHPSGKPSLMFHGEARMQFNRLTASQGQAHLSLSDDEGTAIAFVIVEKL